MRIMSSLPRLLILSSSSSVLMLRPAVAWLVGQPLASTGRHITTTTESGSSIRASRGGTIRSTGRLSISTATTLSSLSSSRRTTIMASTFSTNTEGGSSSSSSSSVTNSNSDDQSAMSRSRAPFRMPRNSPDDSVSSSNAKDDNTLAWNQLGLWTELVEAVTRDLKLPVPTPVQNLVIPKLLQAPTPCDTAFLAATGSGKTLYVLLFLN